MKQDFIGFIGLGLIGGSIAKAIKQFYPNTKIIAIASREQTIQAAYQEGIIENSSMIELNAFSNCDIIFLCSPVGINIKYLKQLKTIISSSTIITDVGSVKGDISKVVTTLELEQQFIGGHPMTGAETTGFENASPYLLENAYYIITTTTKFPRETALEFKNFISSLGALTLETTPQHHDFATAAISHLPHIMASSLVNLVKHQDDDYETLKTIAAGGFRDITRIASSSPVMWQHICLSNPDEILKLLDLFQDELNQFREAIILKNSSFLLELFTTAKDYRDSLPVKSKGALAPVYQCYCDLLDEAGGIATVATILASHHVNLKNIGIVNNREFEQGVLRMEFATKDALDTAIALLQQHHYHIYCSE